MINKNLSDWSAHDLYLAVLRQIGAESSGLKSDNNFLDDLFEECEKRNPEIFKAALEDAAAFQANKEVDKNGNVAALYRSEFMDQGEIESTYKKLLNESTDDLDVSKNLLYFSTVIGNSMTGAGINPGDELIVNKSRKAAAGDIILAKVNGDVFIKNIKIKGGAVTLCSANPDYPDFDINPGDDFEIMGVVIRKIQKIS